MSRLNLNALRSIAFVFATAAVAHAEVTFVQTGGKLVVKSNGDDQTILFGNGSAGEMDATVNGELKGSFIGVRDIQFKGSDGHEFFGVLGIDIAGSLKASMKGGIDAIGIASDEETQRPLYIGGDVELVLGGNPGIGVTQGPETAFIASHDQQGVTIGGNLIVRDAAHVLFHGVGGNNATQVGDIRVGGKLSIDVKSPEPATIELFDMNVHGTTTIKTQAGADVIDVSQCHFVQDFKLQSLDGDDTATFGNSDDPSKFDAAVKINGGPAFDKVFFPFNSTFATPPVVTNVENQPQ